MTGETFLCRSVIWRTRHNKKTLSYYVICSYHMFLPSHLEMNKFALDIL